MYAMLVIALLVGLWLVIVGVRNILDARRERELGVTMQNRSVYNRANRIIARERQLKADAEWRHRGTWN